MPASNQSHCPEAAALVKGFVDRAFLPGFAFRYPPGGGYPEGLLRGRSARVVAGYDFVGAEAIDCDFAVVGRFHAGDEGFYAGPSSTPCSTNPSVPEAPVALLLMLAPAAMTGWWLHRRRPRPC